MAAKAVALPTPPGELAAADLSATLATPPALSLGLERHYALAADGHGLKMRFVLRNRGARTKPSPLPTAASRRLFPFPHPLHAPARRCARRG